MAIYTSRIKFTYIAQYYILLLLRYVIVLLQEGSPYLEEIHSFVKNILKLLIPNISAKPTI